MVSCVCSVRTGTTEHHRSDSAAVQCFLWMAAYQRSDVSSGGGAMMQNEPWVWPKVGDAGTSGAGAVPLRSAQMMGQQQQNKQKNKKRRRSTRVFSFDNGKIYADQSARGKRGTFHSSVFHNYWSLLYSALLPSPADTLHFCHMSF